MDYELGYFHAHKCMYICVNLYFKTAIDLSFMSFIYLSWLTNVPIMNDCKYFIIKKS